MEEVFFWLSRGLSLGLQRLTSGCFGSHPVLWLGAYRMKISDVKMEKSVINGIGHVATMMREVCKISKINSPILFGRPWEVIVMVQVQVQLAVQEERHSAISAPREGTRGGIAHIVSSAGLMIMMWPHVL